MTDTEHVIKVVLNVDGSVELYETHISYLEQLYSRNLHLPPRRSFC
jgi:hypothetical protein